MNWQPVGSIAAAAACRPGVTVRVAGVAVAMRRVGKLSFLLIRDAFSEIQAVVSDPSSDQIRALKCPFYVEISGTIQKRPKRDARIEQINGLIELNAISLMLQGPGGLISLDRPALRTLAYVERLQSLNFIDARSLSEIYAPQTAKLLERDPPGAARRLAILIGPCRWYLVAFNRLYFGICPGSETELRRYLQSELSADSIGREILNQASWTEEPLAPAQLLRTSFGEIFLDNQTNQNVSQSSLGYWSDYYRAYCIDENIIAGAVSEPKIEATTLRVYLETIDRSRAVLNTVLGPDRDGHIVLLERDFPEFDLRSDHVEVLTNLFPQLRQRLRRLEREQQFELVWSIVGHDHVRAILLSERSRELLARCAASGLFADFNVLRHIDPAALESIAILTRNFANSEHLQTIGGLFRVTPGLAPSACYLMELVDRAGLDWTRCVPACHQTSMSELAFFAVAFGTARPDDLAAWRSDIVARVKRLFANDPVDEEACQVVLRELARDHLWSGQAMEFRPAADLPFEVVNLIYGTGLVPYDESRRMYRQAQECGSHWSAAGIGFGGDRWDADSACFRLSQLDMYPSKNRAAILAKSCSGICSARNFALFHRSDHFQFTLVDPRDQLAAGSVQLYLHRDQGGRPVWVLRGLNPSERISIDPVGFTIEVFDALAGLARRNGVSALVCADGCGLFNADSGRLPIRAAIRRIAETAPRVKFDEPLHLFDHHDRSVSVEFGWRVWP